MLDKTFTPKDVEGRIYAAWDASGAFRANRRPDAEPFCIVIPPPNVTGRLHIGHALNNTLQDVLARFERMRGKDVLWQPGMDHAGIATQLVVERQLAEKQQSRVAMGREKFLEAVWKWKDESGGAIAEQLRRLGASADWSRERFTMDEGLSRAVLKVFVELYKQKLIYKDKRLVNWDPRLQTAVSDLEVESIEMKGHLWYIRYPVEGQAGQFITVATTRPETMLGDTAVAVHPDDERYKALIGKNVVLPFANRPIPIIADEHSDPEKGTGAVKITPGHDFNDFEVGKRHNLPLINILNKDGTLNDTVPGAYRGLDRFEARKRIVADLEALELLDKVEPITHAVPHDEKTKTVVLEPLMTEQWYLDVKPLAERAIKAVEDGRTDILPEQWRDVYFRWMRNIHPWCISRQLWWGHQIPAWYESDGKIYVAETEDEARKEASGKTLTRDPDVLDTWFSSALWPFSTLGWPDETNELKRYYPTSVLVTAFDIIFFWVARMMMMGLHFMDDVPFHRVFIHTRVLDEKGAKMSKTKGNVVDPIEIVKQFGTDAVRFTLASMASPGTDIAFNIARTEGYRAFANKIWNAARFIFMNVDKAAEIGIRVDPAALGAMPEAASYDPLEARWIVAEFHAAATEVERSLETYRFDDAADAIFKFFWGNFCDWYLEMVKLDLDFTGEEAGESANQTASRLGRAKAALTTLVGVFEASLRLLSPFMPFLTEEIWHALYDGNQPTKSIALTKYPKGDLKYQMDSGTDFADQVTLDFIDMSLRMGRLQSLIVEVRSLRKEIGVEEKAAVPIEVRTDEASRKIAEENRDIIEKLARVSEVHFVDQITAGLAKHSTPKFEVAVLYERALDVPAERARLTKEIAQLEKQVASDERQLTDQSFLAKAPAKVVEGRRKQLAENILLLERARAALDALPPE